MLFFITNIILNEPLFSKIEPTNLVKMPQYAIPYLFAYKQLIMSLKKDKNIYFLWHLIDLSFHL